MSELTKTPVVIQTRVVKLMRYSRARFGQSTELLGLVFSFAEPTERVVDKFFRRNRNMGAKDRRFLSDIIYLCVRRKLELETLVELSGVVLSTNIEAVVACALLRYFEWSPEDFVETDASEFVDELNKFLVQNNNDRLTLAQQFSLPDWLCDALKAQFDNDELIRLCSALLLPAQVDIRVNARKNSRQMLMQVLEGQNVEPKPTLLSSVGIRVAKRGPLQNSKAFRQGGFEFQDEGSQLVGWLAAPKPGQLVVDYCAGAGGKTLHLAELMENRGRLVACDIYANRLVKLAPRLARANVKIVETLVIDAAEGADVAAPDLVGQADCVLVDAPCSGVGTLRRNVGLKWIAQDLEVLSRAQLNILSNAARLVKPGGSLVYATCSLLTIENQGVVKSFLEKHQNFRPSQNWMPAADPELSGVMAIDSSLASTIHQRGELVLRPDLHNTDGFYAQRLERVH
jgi:16S rRNA (cytosine967-C5)-methyltransferase